jgi:hypothetical protein
LAKNGKYTHRGLGGRTRNGAFRVLVAFFSGVIALSTTVLIPFAYFGDKNETWTKRLIAIAFPASMIFLVALLW